MENKEVRAKQYSSIKNRIFFLELLVSIAILVILQLSGISGWIKSCGVRFTDNPFLITGIYATLIGTLIYIAGIPLGFYSGYVLEHKFSLSNQSLAGWAGDELKKLVISYVIFLLFVEFLYIFLRQFPATWWIWMAAAWIFFGIIFAKLVPVLIIPLFFKYSRLGNEKLKTKLVTLAQSCGVKILDVFKLDLSSKTKKANAALTGMGRTRRILLSDTLLSNYTDGEIEVVMAHELAHHKFKHIWRSLIFGGIFTVIGFYLINASLVFLVDFLGLSATYDIAAFPSIMLLLTVFSILTLPVQNFYSRSLERKADRFAIKRTNLTDDFISCMNKLAKQNLANTAPSKFIEIMRYDHPPIAKRIEMARSLMKHPQGN